MKEKSITMIHEILQQRAESYKVAYRNYRNNLEEKYGTVWLDSVVSKQEKTMLDGVREARNEAFDVLKDYEEHQW